jgi:hypothetical protein
MGTDEVTVACLAALGSILVLYALWRRVDDP